MNRLSIIAATAVVILALAGGAFLLTSGPPGPSTSTPTPTTAPTSASNPTFAGTATTPVALRATWVARTGAGAAPLARLVIQPGLTYIQINGTTQFLGQPVAGASDEFTFQASSASECQLGDVGRYRFGLGADGTVPNSAGTRLGLVAVADACPARQAVLEREWVRAIDVDNVGGRGVAVNFDPMFMVTLPRKTFLANSGTDSLTLDSSDGTAFIATRNPWGLDAPCSSNGSGKIELAPTIAAFTAHIASLPGMTVQQEAVEIDGRPAVHLTVPTTQTAECQTPGVGGRVFEWTTSDPADTGGWFITQGDTDTIYLVEVDGNLFLLQWLEPTISTANELAVLSTVHFVSTLAGF